LIEGQPNIQRPARFKGWPDLEVICVVVKVEVEHIAHVIVEVLDTIDLATQTLRVR
jgi:hypothetical protein